MRTWGIVFVIVLGCRSALSDVKLVQAVFRHGPRTPADTYPNDPHINFDFAPYGWGQLTNEGKLAQFQQGKFLRERYDSLLGHLYSPKLVEVQTTGVDRTIMSAQLEMAGIWPPSPAERWHPDLDWQPTVVHSIPLSEDRLLLVRIPCPKYSKERERVMKTSEVQSMVEELGGPQLFRELTEKTGMNISSPDDVLSLYGTLRAESDFNLTLPEWTKEYYPEKLLPLAALSFELDVFNNDLRMIKGGPLLKKIIADSKDKIKGENDHILYMYAGHDSTIANLLIALGVWDTQVPEYGIMALFELHDLPGGDYGMKVFLRNSTTHEPYPLTVPGCEHLCPMNQFEALTKDVIPDDLDKVCEVDDPSYVPPPPPPP